MQLYPLFGLVIVLLLSVDLYQAVGLEHIVMLAVIVVDLALRYHSVSGAYPGEHLVFTVGVVSLDINGILVVTEKYMAAHSAVFEGLALSLDDIAAHCVSAE